MIKNDNLLSFKGFGQIACAQYSFDYKGGQPFFKLNHLWKVQIEIKKFGQIDSKSRKYLTALNTLSLQLEKEFGSFFETRIKEAIFKKAKLDIIKHNNEAFFNDYLSELLNSFGQIVSSIDIDVDKYLPFKRSALNNQKEDARVSILIFFHVLACYLEEKFIDTPDHESPRESYQEIVDYLKKSNDARPDLVQKAFKEIFGCRDNDMITSIITCENVDFSVPVKVPVLPILMFNDRVLVGVFGSFREAVDLLDLLDSERNNPTKWLLRKFPVCISISSVGKYYPVPEKKKKRRHRFCPANKKFKVNNRLFQHKGLQRVAAWFAWMHKVEMLVFLGVAVFFFMALLQYSWLARVIKIISGVSENLFEQGIYQNWIVGGVAVVLIILVLVQLVKKVKGLFEKIRGKIKVINTGIYRVFTKIQPPIELEVEVDNLCNFNIYLVGQ